jgi:uncharacterized pyridoxamine 5'-phosphate oxidase family protein
MKTNELAKYFQKEQKVALATVEGKKPRVRIMTLIPHEKAFWFVTVKEREKYQQIKNNNNIEFVLELAEENPEIATIRAAGTAREIKDMTVKKKIAEQIEWFESYFKTVENPKYVLYSLAINQLKIHHRGGKQEKIDIKKTREIFE